MMRTSIKIFLTVWLVYLFFIYIYPQSISGQMVDLGMSIVDNGNTYLRYTTGSVDVSLYEGHYFSGHFPGGSLPIIVLYAFVKPLIAGFSGMTRFVIMNFLACVFISTVLGAATASLIYCFLKRMRCGERLSIFSAFVFAFGTMNFGYSLSIYKVIQVSFCMFAAFYLLFRSGERKKAGLLPYLFAGLLAGVGVITHPVYLVMGVVLFIYAILQGGVKRAAVGVVGALIPFALLLLYLKVSFGAYFADPYAYRAAVPPYRLTYPRMWNFLYLLFSTREGFFVYMPVMLLSFFGFVRGIRERAYAKETMIITTIFFCVVVAFAGYVFRSDSFKVVSAHDVSIPIRFLEPVCPFLMVLAAMAFSQTKRWVLYMLSALSVFFAYLAAQAGYLPGHGGTQLWYSIKVLVSSFGMPSIFSEVLPRKMGINTVFTYLTYPDITIRDLLAPQARGMLLILVRNQMFFMSVFLFCAAMAVFILWRIWSFKRDVRAV